MAPKPARLGYVFGMVLAVAAIILAITTPNLAASLSKTLARNRKSCTGVSCFNCGGSRGGHWWHDSGYPQVGVIASTRLREYFSHGRDW